MLEEILPHLYRVVVPLTGNPLREINSFVLTSMDRNLIIDTGMNRPDCREVLETALSELGVDLERTDFIATHLHADHQGLFSTLMRPGSRAFMGEHDLASMEMMGSFWTKNGPMGEYAARSGFPAAELKASLENHPGFKFAGDAPVKYAPIAEGDTFEVGDYSLEAIVTPGHTSGHICLYERRNKLLFSGDHVLGDITPNLQAWSDEHDPLGDYLESLEKVRGLDVELCLPGHRSLIRAFRSRIDELAEHHRVRANEAVAILREQPSDAYRTAANMSWDIVAPSWEDFPIMQRWFATGEAIAHLRYLEEQGLVSRELVEGRNVYSSDGRTLP